MAWTLQSSPSVQRLWMPLVILVLSLSGAAVAADVLVVTEAEQLDGFVDLVTAERLETRLDGALGYVEASSVPCRLQQGGDAQDFQADNAGELPDAVRSALSVFDSSEQHLLQHSVRIDGERATVTARMGDASYEQTVLYDLVRSDDRWLVRRVRTL